MTAQKSKYIERECFTHGITRYKHNGRGYYCLKCGAVWMMKSRHKVMARLLAEFGSCCALCGYNKCPRALHFHHVDPATKEFTIAAYVKRTKYEALLKEAQKCVLLCANCHMEVEDGLAVVSPQSDTLLKE